MIAAQLRKQTKSFGLSLADRACLSLARIMDLPVVTADKCWVEISDILNIPVILIR